jgi:hypothetical protein
VDFKAHKKISQKKIFYFFVSEQIFHPKKKEEETLKLYFELDFPCGLFLSFVSLCEERMSHKSTMNSISILKPKRKMKCQRKMTRFRMIFTPLSTNEAADDSEFRLALI